MNVKAFAIAAGLLWGLLLFVVTLVETARGAGHTLNVLGVLYIGYTVSYLGGFVALAYGFISGALIGAVFSGLYNRLAGKVRPI